MILFSVFGFSQQPTFVYNVVYKTKTAIENKDDVFLISSYRYIIKGEGDDFFPNKYKFPSVRIIE